jgi:hypothetical protein
MVELSIFLDIFKQMCDNTKRIYRKGGLIMNDGEKMWTVEISFGGPPKPEQPISKPSEPLSTPKDDRNGQFTLVPKEEKTTEDSKKQAFLRLRDNVFNMNRGPVNNTFLNQAKKYEYAEVKPAPPVSFMCYWPTYDVMSAPQLDWYLYWRELVRNNTYPHTTLSYIFLYIYELINEIGVENPGDGFVKLCHVWWEYRKTYNSLDRYLKNWISDYIAIHFSQGLPPELLQQITNLDVKILLPEGIILESLLDGGENSSDAGYVLDLTLKYSSYNIEKSKFYQTSDQYFIRQYLAGVIFRLNAHIKKQTGKGIFQSFSDDTPKRRMPYQNAIYQGNVKSVEYGRYTFADNKKLKEFLGDMIKAAENSLRKLTGYKGRLKTNLNPEYARLIDKYITRRQKEEIIEKQSRVNIDKSKVKEIIIHSDIIRDKLLAGIDTAEEETPALAQPSPAVSTQIQTADTQVYSDFDNAFNDNLTSTQRGILEFIKAGQPVDLASLALKFAGVFVQTEIDLINEAALEYLGDILIISDNDVFTIQDIL